MLDTLEINPEHGVIAKDVARSANFRLLGLLSTSSIALFAVFQGMQQILIPAQVAGIDPAQKIENLALLTTFTAIAGVLGLLTGGMLSDSTTGRFGRRAPWLVATSLIGAVLLGVLGSSVSLTAMAVAYASLSFTLGIFQSAQTAILPDRVPLSARGTASAVIGLGTPLGVLVGVNYAARVPQLVGYAGLAALLVVTTFALVVFAPERPFLKSEQSAPALPATRWHARTLAIFSGFRHRDFTLAFVSRALMFLGIFTVTGYSFYILQDMIGVANLPGKDPAIAISVLGSLQVAVWVISVPIAGWLADKFDSRKRIVGFSSLGMVVTMFIPVLFPTWYGMLAFFMLAGIFFGAYMAVDLALMSLVLPDKHSEGRDMAVLNVASAGPQIVSPILAGALITHWGYDQLFYFGALASLAGGLMVFMIRRVR
jgi:MFS family permease